jgi:hypothetical protein
VVQNGLGGLLGLIVNVQYSATNGDMKIALQKKMKMSLRSNLLAWFIQGRLTKGQHVIARRLCRRSNLPANGQNIQTEDCFASLAMTTPDFEEAMSLPA